MKQPLKIESLLLLTRSMTKAEKRYFKLTCSIQGGDKTYLLLFGLLEKNKDEEEIYTLFNTYYPQKSLETATRHLYRVLLDTLARLRMKQDVQTKIGHYLTRANLLFERVMTAEAFDELEKAEALAVTYENDALLLLIRRTELKFLSALNFEGISEKQLVAKQMKINEVMKYARSINQHVQLYDILKHRLIYKGYVRSDKQKADLNDLVLSELNLIANNNYKGFEEEKIHLLFQATYYLNSGNYKSAVRYYKELIRLFETNPHMLLDPPVYYLSALRGILDSLQSAGLYREMPFFIELLSGLATGSYPADFLLEVNLLIYLYRSAAALAVGRLEEAETLCLACEEGMCRKAHLLNPESQLRLHLYMCIAYLSAEKLPDARRCMKKILSAGNMFYALPSYRTARLIHLLLQAESGRTEHIESEIASLKRNIRFEKQVYVTEKLVFRFVLSYPLPLYFKTRAALWMRYGKEADAIRHNKYERQLLKTFDFLSWIEARLTKRPFSEVLADRTESVVPEKDAPPAR